MGNARVRQRRDPCGPGDAIVVPLVKTKGAQGKSFLHDGKNYVFVFKKKKQTRELEVSDDEKKSANSQLFNFAIQRGKADIEQLRCFLTILADLLQHSENMLFLELPRCLF